MRFGKVKESILKRSVLRQLHRHTPFGSPQYGEDAGLFPADDSQLLRANVLAEPVSSGEDRKRDSLFPGSLGPETGSQSASIRWRDGRWPPGGRCTRR